MLCIPDVLESWSCKNIPFKTTQILNFCDCRSATPVEQEIRRAAYRRFHTKIYICHFHEASQFKFDILKIDIVLLRSCCAEDTQD